MRIIDLFAGCGGMSLGFEMAGYNVVLAVEKDENAVNTYKSNRENANVLMDDITQVLNLEELGIDGVDGIIGGPPCQGFSLCGNRDNKDPRNSLFREYVRFVKYYKPKFFVMENVKGILTMKTDSKENVKDIILKEFKDIGYNVDIHILNAAEFGVPQKRERVFFIGIRNDIEYNKDKIKPKGYLFGEEQITIEEAISDLPDIEAKQGKDGMEYPQKELTAYQKWARGNEKVVDNHIAMNHTPRLVERFKQIGFGQSVSDVSEEYSQRKRGDAKKISGKSFKQNNYRPYPDRPAPTIPANFQSNFVHPFKNRNFTAREGARLQSFPDSYKFKGSRTKMSWEKGLSQYNQIGNAVPPLLAKGIAETIKNYFNP